MRRADGLAGGGAAVHNVASVGAVVDVVGLAVPGDGDVGIICIGDSGVIDAVFLAELDGIGLAVLYALAAGDAFLLIDLRGEVRADSVLCTEHFGNAQGKAGAAAAVAYRGRFLKAGGLVYLVDKAIVLSAAENLIGFLLADKAVRAGLAVGDGVIVEIHAHVLFKMAAAFAHKAARAAAGAGADGDSGGVLDERAYLIV